MLSILRNFGRRAYSRKFLPYTNTVTGVFFFGIGDYGVQRIIEKRSHKEVDFRRTGISCIAGGYMGLFGHYWYAFLDRKFPGYSLASVRKKLLCEMVIGPPFAASMFLIVGAMENKSPARIMKEIKDNFKYLVACDWGFYIPLQYFNFYYLPPKYRVLYVAILSLFYDSILVYLLHKQDIEEDLQKKRDDEKERIVKEGLANLIDSPADHVEKP